MNRVEAGHAPDMRMRLCAIASNYSNWHWQFAANFAERIAEGKHAKKKLQKWVCAT